MFVDILATSATVTTILQFLTGSLTCRKIINQGSTGSISSFPFAVALLVCTMWLTFDIMTGNSVMLTVHVIGTSLQVIYFTVFFKYSADKGPLVKQISIVAAILCAVLSYAVLETDMKVAQFRVGIMCIAVTLCFIAAPLLSLGDVIRSKSTASLPAPLITLCFFVSAQWLLYGFLTGNNFIIAPHSIGLTLTIIQGSLFIIYPSKPKAE